MGEVLGQQGTVLGKKGAAWRKYSSSKGAAWAKYFDSQPTGGIGEVFEQHGKVFGQQDVGRGQYWVALYV